MEKSYNQHVKHLPQHLLDYVVDQNYDHYTPVDQAVWRYVMRQNVNYLPSVCHGSYLEGLKKTGLSIECIPSMYGMSRILKDIGWYAVAVDGFIPPTVFMEFQAYNVLVIAADIRQINHIGYTPAPDILHEAAGHAPIIADESYSNYLKRFGEIGSKAFSSYYDIELFDAIRELSILKEAPQIEKSKVIAAEKKVIELQSKPNELSEMAKIRNLHWWTVEYGLIGSVDDPKIYGAGLLSSISESVNCLSNKVQKIKYDISASEVGFDITKEQPQLFVANDFEHLNSVLEEFANNMAFRLGGKYGLEMAINSRSIATCEFDSGIQVSGLYNELIDSEDNVIYFKTIGPTALAYQNKQLKNHGVQYHQDGFGAPIGLINNYKDINDLKEKINTNTTVTYDSGLSVEGKLFDFTEDIHGNIIVLSFKDCWVKLDNKENKNLILFEPSWGVFDLIIATQVTSAYPGSADRNSFPIEKINLKSTTIQPSYNTDEKKLHQLYFQVRNMRSGQISLNVLEVVLDKLINDFKKDWLLSLEICEIVEKNSKIFNRAYKHLMNLQKKYPENKKLILDGLSLIG